MNILLGKKGEEMAKNYLIKNGYQILGQHYCKRVGEIDLIAQKEDEIIFVEVKTRLSKTFGHPEEAVDHRKILKIIKTCGEWLYENKKTDILWRIDVIAIEIKGGNPTIHHLKNVTQYLDIL